MSIHPKDPDNMYPILPGTPQPTPQADPSAPDFGDLPVKDMIANIGTIRAAHETKAKAAQATREKEAQDKKLLREDESKDLMSRIKATTPQEGFLSRIWKSVKKILPWAETDKIEKANEMLKQVDHEQNEKSRLDKLSEASKLVGQKELTQELGSKSRSAHLFFRQLACSYFKEGKWKEAIAAIQEIPLHQREEAIEGYILVRSQAELENKDLFSIVPTLEQMSAQVKQTSTQRASGKQGVEKEFADFDSQVRKRILDTILAKLGGHVRFIDGYSLLSLEEKKYLAKHGPVDNEIFISNLLKCLFEDYSSSETAELFTLYADRAARVRVGNEKIIKLINEAKKCLPEREWLTDTHNRVEEHDGDMDQAGLNPQVQEKFITMALPWPGVNLERCLEKLWDKDNFKLYTLLGRRVHQLDPMYLKPIDWYLTGSNLCRLNIPHSKEESIELLNAFLSCNEGNSDERADAHYLLYHLTSNVENLKQAYDLGHPAAHDEIEDDFVEVLFQKYNVNERLRLWDARQNYVAAYEAFRKGDLTKGMSLLTRAALQGDREAQYALACHFDPDRVNAGGPKDLNKALIWYARAANQGYPNAMTDLAVCFAEGIGIAQNTERAFELREMAAKRGDYYGMIALAGMYIKRNQSIEELKTAKAWLERAAVSRSFMSTNRQNALDFRLKQVNEMLKEQRKFNF